MNVWPARTSCVPMAGAGVPLETLVVMVEYQILLLRIGCRYNAAVSGGNLLIVIIDLHVGDLRIDIAVAVYQRLAYLAVALHLVYQERRCTAYTDGHRQGDLRRRNLLDLLGKQLVADTGYDSDRSDQHQQIDNIDDAEQLAFSLMIFINFLRWQMNFVFHCVIIP